MECRGIPHLKNEMWGTRRFVAPQKGNAGKALLGEIIPQRQKLGSSKGIHVRPDVSA